VYQNFWRKGTIDPGQIISHRISLEKIHSAMEIMERSDRNKVIINP